MRKPIEKMEIAPETTVTCHHARPTITPLTCGNDEIPRRFLRPGIAFDFARLVVPVLGFTRRIVDLLVVLLFVVQFRHLKYCTNPK